MKGDKDVLLEMLQSGEPDALGAALLEENRRLADDPSFIPPTESQQAILSDAHQELEAQGKRRRRDTRVKRLATLKRVAIIAVIIVTLAATVMTVEAIRIPILNFFTEAQERATRISSHSDEDLLFSQADPANVESYELRWVPDGFDFESKDIGADYYQQNYINADGVILRFRVWHYLDYWFDTEDADLIEPLQVNEMEAYYVEKGGRSLLMWADETNLIVFSLLGKLPKETLVQIAENSGLKKLIINTYMKERVS